MTSDSPTRHRAWRLFLPGATWRERFLAALGALLAVGLTGLLGGLAMSGLDPAWTAGLPQLVAPVGASAVLLFVVPSSPMAQPWPIVGGNVLSCLVGVAVARLVPETLLAAALALPLAILAMSLARCLHPPGGAAALIAVLGGPAVSAAGFGFALLAVGLETLVLVALGWAFHRLRGRAYPHRPPPPAPQGTADRPAALRAGFQPVDVDRALADMGEAFDIDRDDLDRLLRQVEQRALERAHGALAVADIMSRDLVGVGPETAPDAARELLLRHRVRSLPVLDGERRLLGVVGLRELTQPGSSVAALMAQAPVAGATQPALSLVPALSDGRSHAVMVVDAAGRLVGLVTQTDLLAALARLLATSPAPASGP